MSVCRVCKVDKALWDFVEVPYGEPDICIPCSEKAALEREAVRRQPTVQQALRQERVASSLGRVSVRADRMRFQWALRDQLLRLQPGIVLEVVLDKGEAANGVSRGIGTVIDDLNAELSPGEEPFGKMPKKERIRGRTRTVGFYVGRVTRRDVQ